MQQTKQWFLSKTLWLNAVTFLVTVLSLVPQSFDMSEGELKGLLFVVSILNVVLRMAGSQPIALAAKK
jgi:hypothetical protein